MRRAWLALLVAAAPILMAPECGASPALVNCDTVEFHRGTQALEPDGTLDLLKVDHNGATWERWVPPWTGPPTQILQLPGAVAGPYLPRAAAAAGGGRLFVRGPAGPLDDAIYELDQGGIRALVTPLGAGDHLDFAAAFDGATPFLLSGRYGADAGLALTFLQGGPASGDNWNVLASLDVPLASPPSFNPSDAPFLGQPIALAREANGTLVGFELNAGLMEVSASGTLTQPSLSLPHPAVVGAAALTSDAGEAVVFLLAEDLSNDAGGELRLDRLRRDGGDWIAENLPVQAPWAGLHNNRIDSQLGPIGPDRAIVMEATIGDLSSDYALFDVSLGTDGGWSYEVPCVDPNCTNAQLWHGYSRIPTTAGGLFAINGGDPDYNQDGNNYGKVAVFSPASPQWSATYTDPIQEIIFHGCVRPNPACGCASSDAVMLPALLWLCASATRRRRRG